MPENNTAEPGVSPEASEGQSGRGLKLHHLRPAPGAHKAKTRVGRGEASKGKTAGRGTKGTKARTQVRIGFARGAARKGELIKVLGTGEIDVALRVTAHAFSATAAAKIEQAGGTVTELS